MDRVHTVDSICFFGMYAEIMYSIKSHTHKQEA